MGANIVAWINWRLDPSFMARNFTLSLAHIREGRWYTIITHCFSHRDGWHLASNLITLYFFWNRSFSGRLVRSQALRLANAHNTMPHAHNHCMAIHQSGAQACLQQSEQHALAASHHKATLRCR